MEAANAWLAFVWTGVVLFGATAVIAFVLTVLHRLGRPGAAIAESLTRAWPLDMVVSLLTWIPWLASALYAGWIGLAGCLVGQIAALVAWVRLHELAFRDAARGPRIVKFLDRQVGWWRNRSALWVTTIALPGFLLVRFMEIAAYPFLIWLLGFPRYRHGDWINVSRFKFQGLVGHDLIWCLYCDWMTGVYSFGAEMLRNVESFWCPIRFLDSKKIENTAKEFPDLESHWIGEGGSMADVEDLMRRMYGEGGRSWFSHPERLIRVPPKTGRPAGGSEGEGDPD
jgi:hypothetical protein